MMDQGKEAPRRLYESENTDRRFFKLIGYLISMPITVITPFLLIWWAVMAGGTITDLIGNRSIAKIIAALLLPPIIASGPFLNRLIQRGLSNAWRKLIGIRLAEANLSISPGKPQAGYSFILTYQLPIKRQLSIAGLTVQLIQRTRTISYQKFGRFSESVAKKKDRLIQELIESIEWQPEPGETFQRELRLTIPTTEPPTSQKRDTHLEWVIRTRLHVHGWPDLQEEYPIKIYRLT